MNEHGHNQGKPLRDPGKKTTTDNAYLESIIPIVIYVPLIKIHGQTAAAQEVEHRRMEMEKLKEDEPEWGGVPHNKTRNGDWKLETYGNNLWLLNIAMEAMAHF